MAFPWKHHLPHLALSCLATEPWELWWSNRTKDCSCWGKADRRRQCRWIGMLPTSIHSLPNGSAWWSCWFPRGIGWDFRMWFLIFVRWCRSRWCSRSCQSEAPRWPRCSLFHLTRFPHIFHCGIHLDAGLLLISSCLLLTIKICHNPQICNKTKRFDDISALTVKTMPNISDLIMMKICSSLF